MQSNSALQPHVRVLERMSTDWTSHHVRLTACGSEKRVLAKRGMAPKPPHCEAYSAFTASPLTCRPRIAHWAKLLHRTRRLQSNIGVQRAHRNHGGNRSLCAWKDAVRLERDDSIA